MDTPSPQPASPALPESVKRFLDAPRYATISTVLPDGSPHQAVVWYTVDGDSVLINSRRGRRWPANLEADPRIALAVFEDVRPEHWVGIRGIAELVREGPAAVLDIQAMARRYDGDPSAYEGQNRVTFRIRVTTTFEYGDD